MSTGAQNYLLPLPGTFPTKTICVQLAIPDDPEYFRDFYGQLEALSNWYAWDRDAMHSGKFVARIWQKVLASIKICESGVVAVGCGCDCDCCGDDMDWRQQGCELQKFDCLTGEWVTVFDSSLCTVNPAPGIGSIQPPGGQSANTCLTADAQTLTPLPWAVSAGDTLDFTNIEGASTDPSLHYFCPDGSFYVLGACAGGGYTSSGDPLNTTKHQALLLKIGSAFYPLVSGTFTVPSGISGLVPYIQVNNSALSTSYGKYNVCVTYQNNASPPVETWCADLKFALSPYLFNPVVQAISGSCTGAVVANGSWVPATGWQGYQTTQSDCVHTLALLAMRVDLGASYVLNTVTLKGSLESFHPDNAISVQISNDPTFASGVTTLLVSVGDPAGAFLKTASGPFVSARYVQVVVGNLDSSGGVANAIATELTLAGNGTIPNMWPSCV